MIKLILILFIFNTTINAQTSSESKSISSNNNQSDVSIQQGKEPVANNESVDQQSLDTRNIDESKMNDDSNTDLNIIEIDGIKYVRDGMRYIPIAQNIIQNRDETEKMSDEKEVEIESVKDQSIAPLSYFGYQIFQGDPSIFQSSTFGSVDPNYNIGPGDEIIVMLWGESQFRESFIVDREGYVFIPDVGQVFVNGLILEDLEKKIFLILSKVYSTLNPINGKPTSFMDISLGNLRPLRIIVLGEVNQPGAYSVSPSSSLSSSLYYFRGPTTAGSLRDIRLIRGGNTIASIDFYQYLLSGYNPNDIRLQLDDIVFIPPRVKTISIRGQIKRPGIYELKDNEGLKDLIDIAGNLNITAYLKRAQISRIVAPELRSESDMDRVVVDLDLVDAISNNIDMQDGDVIEIFSIEEAEKNYVQIFGSSITRPGKYQLIDDMRVLDLIEFADGLLNDSYKDRAHIIRIEDDLTRKIISINLNKVINKDTTDNILLKYLDQLIIYNKNVLDNAFSNVSIFGPIKNEGSYLLENDKNLGDLLILSGGFISGVSKVKITVTRLNPKKFNPSIFEFPSRSSGNNFIEINDLSNPSSDINNFILKENDIVNIFSDPKGASKEMVQILGAVFYPGNYPVLNNNDKVSDIIKRAGGLLPQAYPMASTFLRNNKSIKISFVDIIENPSSKKNFVIMPGDKINISTKPNIVEIVGAVNNAGAFQFFNSSTVKDYINLAGGLAINADKKQIWITYPDGSSKQYKPFLGYPKVYDGSTIFIGATVTGEPIDRTALAKDLASIISDLLQTYISLAILLQSAAALDN